MNNLSLGLSMPALNRAVIAALCGFAFSANANTIYVEVGNGFDNAGNGTQASPYSPLPYALEHANDGDTLLLNNGTYILSAELVVEKGVTIKSLSENKNDVIFQLLGNHRLVRLNHADARLAYVTLVGTGTGSRISCSGCGVQIGTNGGTLDHATVRNFHSGAYASVGGGVYVSNSADALVDSVVISNCSTYAESGGGGFALYQEGGIVRNSLFIHNDNPQWDAGDGNGGTVKIVRGEFTHNTVACNRGKKSTPGVWASNSAAKIRDSIIAGNINPATIRVADHAWYGYASCFSNCVCSSYINEFCYLEDDPFDNLAVENLYPSPMSHAMNGSAVAPWMSGATDIAGNARVSGTAPDMGAFEKPATELSADFSANVSEGFAPVTVTYAVYVNGIESADVACLWDWDGDGNTDETTYGLSAQHQFGAGSPMVGLVVSNITTGATYAVPRKLNVKSVSSTLYVVRDNPGAAAPYATFSTAAATLDDAFATAIAGCMIIVSNGTHLVSGEIILNKAVKIRGFSGVPEEVIIKAKSKGYRLFRLLDPEAEVSGVTITGANGVSGTGAYIASGGGTISNAVIHTCHADSYNNVGAGIYIEASNYALVDSVVISNCDAYCEGQVGGYAIYMAGGTVRNSLFLYNYPNHIYANTGGGTVRLTGGELVNCTLALNRGKSCPGVWATGTAKVRNCIISENTLSDSLTPLALSWMGTASCFTNCICSIEINNNCFIEEHPFSDISIVDLSPSAKSHAVDGASIEPWMIGANDILGNPRVSGPRPDIGAVEMDKSIFSAQFEADVAEGFAPVTVHYTVMANGAESNEIACYWDWNGDGVYDEITEGLSASHQFQYTDTDVSMLASNKTTGATYVVPSTARIKSVGQTIYVRNDNANPVTPYATWATAAAKLTDATDIAIGGCTILVSNGLHTVNRDFALDKGVKIRGADGIATNVIIRAAGNGYRFGQITHPDSEISGITIEGFRPNASGAGIYIGAYGGTVSNVVIRNCHTGNYGTSGGGICIAAPSGTDHALVDSVVISNCSAYCESTGGNAVAMSGGIVRNSLFMYNYPNHWLANRGGTVWIMGGTLENCTVAFNTGANCPGIWADGANGKVISCIIAENTCTATVGNPLQYTWQGTASCFTNCVASLPINDFCFTEEHPFASLEPLDLSPSAKSAAFDGAEEKEWMIGTLDIFGNPRIVGNAPDIGAVEAQAATLVADFEATGTVHGFAPLTVAFEVTALGVAPGELDCYWDWGDGEGEELIEYAEASHEFPLGCYTVRLRVRNRATRVEYSVPSTVSVKSIGRTLYVRDGDQEAAAPFANWNTASTNLNEALDMALDGCEIIVSDGECRVPAEAVITKAVNVRGAGGRYGTVLKSVNNGHRVFRLENASASVRDLTVCDVNGPVSGAGIYIGVGGTVSNVFVHSCTSYSYGSKGGGIYIAPSSDALVDSVIISNCTAHTEGDSGGTALSMASGVVRNGLFICQRSPSGGEATPMGTVAISGGELVNCTIATNVSRLCAGVYATGGKVVNCLIADNVTTHANAEYSVYACELSLRNSIFENCAAPIRVSQSSLAGENFFKNPAAGDFRLRQGSTAIDKGIHEPWMAGARDLGGNPRVSNGKVDIGCFEYPPKGFNLILR